MLRWVTTSICDYKSAVSLIHIPARWPHSLDLISSSDDDDDDDDDDDHHHDDDDDDDHDDHDHDDDIYDNDVYMYDFIRLLWFVPPFGLLNWPRCSSGGFNDPGESRSP